LIDQFLERALEVDVDLVRGRGWSVVGGIVEHIEAAGVHSGDSMGVLPPQRLRPDICLSIEDVSVKIAEELDIIGHLNLQLAIKDDEIYVLEANPRSSRSVPFISKATGIPMAKLGVMAMLEEKNTVSYDWKKTPIVCVKGVVFPFKKFREADSILGPEMKSTGESMGRGLDYPEALMKAFIGSHHAFHSKGEVFFSLRDKDKPLLLSTAKSLAELGFKLLATQGTAQFFESHGLKVEHLSKVHEGRPHCVDRIRSGPVVLVINTTSGRKAIQDSYVIRRSCIDYLIPCITESDTAAAFVVALKRSLQSDVDVRPLAK